MTTYVIDLYFCFSFIIAVVAVTYSCILVEPGMILHSWRTLVFNVCQWILDRTTKYTPCDLQWYDRKTPYEFWLYKIIVGCQDCVAGQMALWSILAYQLHKGAYNPILHIFAICLSVYLAHILNCLLNKCR